MRSLFLRIFWGYWLIIALVVGAALAIGYVAAGERRDEWRQFDHHAMLAQAARALESGGESALARWLRDAELPGGLAVYVVDRSGTDLLERELPRMARRQLRHALRAERHAARDKPDPRIRPLRPVPQLVSADGAVYNVLVGPDLRSFARRGPLWPFLLAALGISALVSWFIARTITRPVRALQSATRALAAGDFGARVAPPLAGRRDELGALAGDFNAMATRLEDAIAARRELLRNLSHELRSPLARIKVALGLAERGGDGEAVRERLEREADRLDRLIGEILEFSRLDEAALHPEAAPIALGELVDGLIADMRFELGEAGPRILRRDDLDPVVDGYELPLRSAIENLLRNAARHAAAAVEVGLAVSPESVAIAVSDDGEGAAPETLAAMFEPFWQGDNGGSAGLGLAIVERVAQLHGGEVRARNRTEGGLEVTLSLARRPGGQRDRRSRRQPR